MKNRTHLISFAAGTVVCATLGLGLGFIQPEKVKEKIKHAQPEQAIEHAMPDMDAMFAEMAAMATPDEHHAELEKFIGNWHTRILSQMPGAEPEEFEGMCHSKWILGGRFVQTDFKGDIMGQPVEGLAIMGYDKYHKEYVVMWVDTLSTAMNTSKGQISEDGTLSMSGIGVSPMGENLMRLETSFVSDDKFVDTFFEKWPDGEWMQTMTVTYTRNKKGG